MSAAHPPLFGLETEYALAAVAGNGLVADRAEVVSALLDVARRRLVYLFDGNASGIFVENGSRFYIDAGLHPEWCTPECLHPAEVVRYAKAGEQWLAEILDEARAKLGLGSASLFRANVDYANGATWGCHESYLHRTDPRVLAPQLIPHFVSRVVYTGAGGFEPWQGGLRFTLSPRARRIVNAISDSSTSDRGIYHTKQESLSRGYQRLHVLCGESLCSELGGFLKIGTTALVVRLVELGDRPGDAVAPLYPVRALHRFASDPTCDARVITAGRQRLRATAIQRHYLEAVEARLGHPNFPQWATVVCVAWRRVLDALDAGPAAVATSLDWGIKLACFRAYAERHGMRWMELGRLIGPVGAPSTATAQLCELDLRFGEVGARSIFDALDRAGALDHRIAEVGDVASARSEPPPRGRARARGLAIRRLAAEPATHVCDWSEVIDREGRRVVDLSDPFAGEAALLTHPAAAPGPDAPFPFDPFADDGSQLDFDFQVRRDLLRRVRRRPSE